MAGVGQQKRPPMGVLASASSSSSSTLAAARAGANPLAELTDHVKSLEAGLRAWLAEQPTHVEAAVATAVGAVQGGALGGLMGTLAPDSGSALPVPQPPLGVDPKAMASFKQAQALAGGPLVQARNFAVMTGANAGISCVVRRIRGVEDVQGSISAAFASGALFSIVSGMGTPNPVVNAVTTGVAFAVFQGGFFMAIFKGTYWLRYWVLLQPEEKRINFQSIGQKFSQPKGEDAYYSCGRSMLQELGLQNYEKNFKKGLLTDQNLPLLTDSALRDVKIPPGPRLLILDHIKRDPELTRAS